MTVQGSTYGDYDVLIALGWPFNSMTNKRSPLPKRSVFIYLLVVLGASNSVSTHVSAEISLTPEPDKAPVILNFTPSSGSEGNVVYLYGTNFFDFVSVKFNGVETLFDGFVQDSMFTYVPTNATTGPITIETSWGTFTTADVFTVTNRIILPPEITDFDPKSGFPGFSVKLFGANILHPKAVKFNGIDAAFESIGDLYTQVPLGATTGPITIETEGGTFTTAENFTVTPLPVPEITEFSPQAGPAGTMVTFRGSGFLDILSVKFNGVEASISPFLSVYFWVHVPTNATSGPITIETRGGTFTTAQIFVIPVTRHGCPLPIPSPFTPITGFIPRSGPAGTQVIILGRNLDQATAVWFNSKRAAFSISGDLVAEVPQGAKCGQITIATPDGTFNSNENFDALTSGDLFLSQAASPEWVTTGENLSFTILVTNRGPTDSNRSCFSV